MISENASPPSKPVYLDHNATTPVDARVLEAMLPYFTEYFGNAASIDHVYGNEASQAVEIAREKVANVISAKQEEIIFTSGATESDNLALIGIAEQYSDKGRHIITCATEHKAVLDTCKYLEHKGFQVTYLPVDKYGIVDLDQLRNSINDETILISVMAANNEIGTIAPISDIGAIAKEKGVPFHTDAAQAFGHIPLNVESMGIDLMSISGHKIYGPKGIGALYVRRLRPRIKLTIQMHGGGHERGLRSGTLNVPGVVGLGTASEIAKREMSSESKRLTNLRDHLWKELKAKLSDIELNGHPELRLPNNLNIYIPGIDSRALLVQVKYDASMSAGSACTSKDVVPSHVLSAIGQTEERIHSSIRIGLGRCIRRQEDLPIMQITDSVSLLRSMR